MKALPVVSLAVTYRGGTTWCASSDSDKPDDVVCGIHPVHGIDQGDVQLFRRYPAIDERGYHGAIYLVDVTASPPARS
jgi:hypothetical protein